MADPPVPYWLLIAVLQSTVPLLPALAMRLYRAAIELHQGDENVAKLTGELAMGEVRRLRKVLAIGSITGPGFEADVDTPQGSGQVRFVVTREGLSREGLGEEEEEAPPAAPRMLN